MKIIKKFTIFVFLAVIILHRSSALAQSGPPPFPTLPDGVLLDAWQFSGTNFLSLRHSSPLSETNVALVPTWDGNGLQLDSTNAALITYPVLEPNGHTNLDLSRGTIEMWFSPDWNSTDGLGSWAPLLEVGSWDTNLASATGAWGLYISPDGSNLCFSAETNGIATNYLNAPIDWVASDWHQIVLTYSATNSMLYLEGSPVTNGPGISVIPSSEILSNGFAIGSDGNATGMMQSRGIFNAVATFSYQMDADTIAEDYLDDTQFVFPLPFSGGHFTMDGPGLPGGVGGTNSGSGGGGTPDYTPPTYTTNDFYLTVLSLGTNAYNMDSNSISVVLNNTIGGILYQLWSTTNLQGTNTVWTLETNVFGSVITNFSVAAISMSNRPTCFFKGVSYLQDSDGDGLPDAFERLFSHTNPNSWDSNGNGKNDASEVNSNGLAWRSAFALQTSAIIVATISNAAEAGSCGQCTIYLPSPAPSGGTVVQYRLGGMSEAGIDYTITPTNGSVTIPAGSSSGTISICANTTTAYAPISRYLTVTLTNASTCQVDSVPAQVNLIDTNKPGVRVFALPTWVRNPSATFGTNSAAFYFVRDGEATNSATVNFTISGTAASGTNFTALPTSITFPSGARTNVLSVNVLQDTLGVGDKTISLNITGSSGYQIDSQYGSATITIVSNNLTPLPTIQVVATDSDARELATNTGTFTFTRTTPTNATLRVYYHVWGTAIPSYTNTMTGQTFGNYVALPGYVDIMAGASNATVTVTPINDGDNLTSTVILTIGGGGDYLIGTSNSATVYIDDPATTSYSATITRPGVYGSSVSQDAEIQIIRYGSALNSDTMHYSMAYGFGGNTLSSYVVSGDVSGPNVFWAAHTNIANIKIHTVWASYADSAVTPTLTLSNSTAKITLNILYHPPSDMVTVSSSSSPATVLQRGGSSVTGALVFNRPHPNGNSFSLSFVVQGSAALSTSDVTINNSVSTTVFFAAGASTVSVPAQAFTNSAIGWKTAVISMNPGAYSTQVGIVNQDRAFLRIQDSSNTNTDTDIDGDLIPDGWELNNMSAGYDPQLAQNPYSDDDRDGSDLIEEIALGTDPVVADAQPAYPSVDQDAYVPITLRVGEAGKLPNTNNACAVCHETSVRVGSFMRTCPRNGSRSPVSQDFLVRLLKGTNYPIQVSAEPSFLVLPTSKTNGLSPAYTASYTAQLLSGTNGIYPFITDTNHVLGTNLPMVAEVLAKRAILYVPDLLIAADVDRDGSIDFTNRTDRSSTNQYFNFWINDDVDTGSDDTAADLEPDLYFPDSSHSNITCVRDLEDFSRLQFYVDGLPGSLLTNAGMQLCVYLTNISGTPSLKLFHSVETNGGLNYLTNTSTATAQTGAAQLGQLTNGTPLTLSGTNWVAVGSNKFLLPMIFEGVTTGKCVITFGFCSNSGPVLAMSRPFYLNLQSLTNIYEHWTVGDDTTSYWAQIPARAKLVAGSVGYGAPTSMSDLDYIIFVHGWRMEPWERRAFANTAYKRLWQVGYKGRFVLYSWPTDWVDLGSSHLTDTSFWKTTLPNGIFNTQNFDRSEQRAWNSSRGLLNLTMQLNSKSPSRVRIMAHSMGNVVVGETLRAASDAHSGRIFDTYIAMQGALASQVYDSNATVRVLNSIAGINNDSGTFNNYLYFWPVPTLPPSFSLYKQYLYDVTNAARLMINYCNVNDAALSGWRYNQDLKPDWDATDATYWRFVGGTGYLRFTGGYTRLDPYYDRFEIFSRAAEARCYAMGSQTNLAGPFANGASFNQVNLAAAFGFSNADSDHSGEFNSIFPNRYSFWLQVLTDFGIDQ